MRVFRSIFSFSNRKLFVGGNWKSNNTIEQTKDLINNVINKIEYDPNIVGKNKII
jgi:triosephosphate isomerase